MTTTPPVDNDAELATAVSDFLDTRTATWAEVQVIARLAENGMATQDAEHAAELRRAWEDGRTAGERSARIPIYGDDEHDRREPTNPYPETALATAEVVIDGEVFTWRQLPEYVGRLLIRLREAEHDAKRGHIDALEQHARTVVLDEVSAERDRQIAKWGHQHHPAGTGPDSMALARISAASHEFIDYMTNTALANVAKFATDTAAEDHSVTFADILLEEVFEALAEAAPEGLRHKLIQVAAVAVQIAEEIDAGQIVEPE